MSALRHCRAILLLPFLVTVVVPATILLFTGPDTFDLWQSYPATRVALPLLGGALICLGVVLVVATIRPFVTVGKGTLAPWNPTQRLVVRGVYRHARNPMIAGACNSTTQEANLRDQSVPPRVPERGLLEWWTRTAISCFSRAPPRR